MLFFVPDYFLGCSFRTGFRSEAPSLYLIYKLVSDFGFNCQTADHHDVRDIITSHTTGNVEERTPDLLTFTSLHGSTSVSKEMMSILRQFVRGRKFRTYKRHLRERQLEKNFVAMKRARWYILISRKAGE